MAEGHLQALCRDCDGVGWVEGGKTLQTTCRTCEGRGATCCDAQWDDPIHQPRPSEREQLAAALSLRPVAQSGHGEGRVLISDVERDAIVRMLADGVAS